MLIYILKFSACLTIFMVFYKLFLEKSSAHTFKRFYLLGVLALALIIPSITFIEYIEPVVVNDFEILESTIIEPSVIVTEPDPVNYLPIILWSVYSIGAFIFLLKFSINLYRIISRIKNNPKYKSESFINVLIQNLIIPHTFFSYIFLNKHKFENSEIPEEVILHEQTHAQQKHSIDILILEILQILFWFNPLLYLLKRDVKLNHEFLADRAVLECGVQPSTYQQLLLAFSSNASEPQLANAINYSSIKKRFTVMKTKTSKSAIWLRSLLLLPLLAIVLYSFTERKQVEKDNLNTNLNTYATEGATEAQMEEYNAFIIKFNTTHIIDFSKYERIVSIYNLMTDAQKASVEAYPKVPNIDLSKTKGKVPTKSQFESWKNEKEYAIWLDGVHIPNVKLNSYAVEDIAHYVGSFAHENARSEKFPQPYQYSLYTKKGFEVAYQKSKINEYHQLTKTYSDAIKQYLKGPQTDNSELRLLKERCDRLYKSFSAKELEENGIRPAPPVPAKRTQEGATPKQIAEYNKQAKYYNDNLNNKHITIYLEDVERLKYLYGLMTDKQRKNAEPFPDFPKPPPPPPPTKEAPNAEWKTDVPPPPPPLPENPTLKQKEQYKKNLEYYNRALAKAAKEKKEMKHQSKDVQTGFKKINGTIHFFVSVKGNTKYYNRKGFEVSKKGKVLSATQVNASDVIPNQYVTKVYTDNKLVAEFKDNKPNSKGTLNIPPPPPPPLPENATSEQKKAYEKNLKHYKESLKKAMKDNQEIIDVPPPPPPPKNPLDFVIEMAKKDAVFYLDDTKITSDKAIEIVKSKAFKHIQVVDEDAETPVIRISKDAKVKNTKNLPKPTPKNIADHIKVMHRHGARFFLEQKLITYEEALKYVRKHKNADVRSSFDTNTTIISLPKDQNGKTVVLINGKFSSNNKLTLSKKEFNDLKLTVTKVGVKDFDLKMNHTGVKSFKFKVPGKRTVAISGNTLDDTSKSNLEGISVGSTVQFFDIKSNTNLRLKPIIVTITE